jgi:hypothetical protein
MDATLIVIDSEAELARAPADLLIPPPKPSRRAAKRAAA